MRGEVFAIQPAYFQNMLDRKIRITGLPKDAKYIRSWHDPNSDRFYLLYEHESFGELIEGALPMPKPFTVTTFFEEEPEA
jgi:hypothetical protein